MTENRQFHHFIIITMILTAAHDVDLRRMNVVTLVLHDTGGAFHD